MSLFKKPWKIVDNVATNASKTSAAVSFDAMSNARWTVSMTATSTPVGTFKLQASDDVEKVERDKVAGTSTATWFDVTLPDGCVHIHSTATGVSFTGPDIEIDNDGTAAALFSINVFCPWARMRLVYTRTIGGTTNGYTAWVAGRE